MNLHLMTRTALIDRLRILLRDTGDERWSDTEFEAAINQALSTWIGRVSVPLVYSQQFTLDVYEYALPDYIRGVVHPQWQDDGGVWHDYTAYTMHTDGAGGFVLQMLENPGTYTGRLFHYFANGQLPMGAVTLGADLASDGTEAALSSADLPYQGYLKIGNEWLQFAGVERGATGTVQNLVRGVYDTTAASHSSGAAVEFGIAMPELSLVDQMADQVAANLHRMYLSDGSAQDRAAHERMVAYHDARAERFWRQWIPRKPRLTLGEPPMFRARDGYGVFSYGDRPY